MCEQKENFDEAVLGLQNENCILHIANSNATLGHKEFFYSMVRCGFACYGWSKREEGFKPALKIVSKITSVHFANSGESVGYDRTAKLNSKTKIATVPIGYADGLDRKLSNRGYFYCKGKRVNIIGNICMDCTMVDVSCLDDVEVGDPVLILGEDEYDNEISLGDYAELLDTSQYDVLLKFRRARMNSIYKE